MHSALIEALTAHLLPEPEVAVAREVLERLAARVPGWLERTPISGEAGYISQRPTPS